MTQLNLSAVVVLLVVQTHAATTNNGKVDLKKIGSFKEALMIGSHSEASSNRMLSGSNNNNQRPSLKFLDQMHRSFFSTEASEEMCDVAFFTCLDNAACTKCFSQIEDAHVDWASVSPTTPCSEVVDLLNKNNSCKHLKNKQENLDLFCKTFDACLGLEKQPDEDSDDKDVIDCDALTSCEWDGMHAGFIGDGTCQSFGCYNHKVCNYDGGDCCEDTCKSDKGLCGNDDYVCIDPESKNCNPFLTDDCTTPDVEKEKEKKEIDEQTNPSLALCGPDETSYRLFQYDSWGDGWDQTQMTISFGKKEIYKGSLTKGFEGSEYICLSSEPACYTVNLKGGTWGNEVSWEIKPARAGTRAVAQGGSPQTCEFPVAHASCKNTCDKFPTKDDRMKDPDYKSYKQAFHCAQRKCYLQLGTCKKDKVCTSCLGDDSNSGDCYASDEFNAVVECTMCNCFDDDATKEFCESKERDGANTGNKDTEDEQKNATRKVPQCNSEQIKKGSRAALQFSKCSDFDQISATVTQFDNENFGALDTFESCAHTFQNEPRHGGKKALDCMNILQTAIKDPLTKGSKKDAPAEAISALASKIYNDAEPFCDCSTEATTNTPACSSFMNFKTLLFETLDACQALDEIDCDAFNEFQGPCKENLINQFNRVDFENSKQCDYVQNGCGGVGAFPAFRRLDCERELPKQSWDFYQDYSKKCLKKSSGNKHVPVPSPKHNSKHHASRPTYHAPTTPYVSKDDDDSYVPDEDVKPEPEPYVPEEKKHTHGFLWFMFTFAIVGGAGYWYRKKRMDSFDFTRYRRVRARNYGQDSDLFDGLSSNNAASSFEPPSLPPPPSAMGDKEMA